MLFAFASRSGAFLVVQGDANVDTYFYVARVWLHGVLPYVAAWEYKPPGLFALFALGLLVFRNANLASAVFGTLAVIATALSVDAFVRTRSFAGAAWAGALAAWLTVMLSSENLGLRGDAELYVNAFLALSLALAATQERARAVVLAGLFAGCALQMKLSALPMLCVPAALVLQRSGYGPASLLGFTAVAGAPFVLEAALYARAGALSFLIDANYGATVRRALGLRGTPAASNGTQWLRELRLLAPALELTPFALLERASKTLWLAWAWFLTALIAIAAAGEFYDKHFVLLVPPLAVLGAAGSVNLGRLVRKPSAVALLTLGLTFALHNYYEIVQAARISVQRYIYGIKDSHAGSYFGVSGALRRAMGADRSLYVLQFSPWLYTEVNAVAPTRYVFSGNLLEPAMTPMLGFEGSRELRRILATRPHYLVVGDLSGKLAPRTVTWFLDIVRRDYRLVDDTGGARIYKRIENRTGT